MNAAETMMMIPGEVLTPKEKRQILMNGINGKKVSSKIVMTGETIELVATADDEWECEYCGSVRTGDRCEGCGAPRKRERRA